MSSTSSIYDLLGKVDNLNDPVPPLNKRSIAYGVVISFLALAYVCASLRLYVRFRVTRCPWWDDFFIVLSMVAGGALAVSVCIAFNYHMGEHLLTFAIDTNEVVNFTKASYVSTALYPTATALIKTAILMQFLRLFEERPRYRQATIAMLIVTSLWGLAFSFVTWFPAFPVSAFWDLDNTDAIRYGLASLNPDQFTAFYFVLNSTNMIIDLLILLIPLPFYLLSSMTWKSRISLVGLFLVGTAINVISLGRLVYVLESKAGTYPTLDPSFYGCSPVVLSTLEVSCATIAASLPVFWPMIRFDWGSIFVTTEISVTQELSNDEDRSYSKRLDPWDVKAMPMVLLDKKKHIEEDEEAMLGPLPNFKSKYTPMDRAAIRDSLYAATV